MPPSPMAQDGPWRAACYILDPPQLTPLTATVASSLPLSPSRRTNAVFALTHAPVSQLSDLLRLCTKSVSRPDRSTTNTSTVFTPADLVSQVIFATLGGSQLRIDKGSTENPTPLGVAAIHEHCDHGPKNR